MQAEGIHRTGDGEPDLGPAAPVPPPASRPHRRPVALLANSEVAPSIHVLEFGLAPDDPMEFLPGQYVTFLLERQGRPVTRSYSIFSSADRHDRFSLLVKRVPQGFASNLLCDRAPSDAAPLTVLAPLGRFVLHDPGDRSVLLVATGVGLAPFVPMLERLRRDYPATPTRLVWGNRYVEEMVARVELDRVADGWPGFHREAVISRPPSDGGWSGRVGHVQECVRALCPDLSRTDVYLCGANAMVNDAQELALELHCPKDHVFVDRWGESEE